MRCVTAATPQPSTSTTDGLDDRDVGVVVTDNAAGVADPHTPHVRV